MLATGVRFAAVAALNGPWNVTKSGSTMIFIASRSWADCWRSRPACHEVKHIGLAGARGRAEIAVKHLAQVNEWDLEAACLHVDSCFEVWSQRSEHQWQLDISFVQIYELPAQEKINL